MASGTWTTTNHMMSGQLSVFFCFKSYQPWHRAWHIYWHTTWHTFLRITWRIQPGINLTHYLTNLLLGFDVAYVQPIFWQIAWHTGRHFIWHILRHLIWFVGMGSGVPHPVCGNSGTVTQTSSWPTKLRREVYIHIKKQHRLKILEGKATFEDFEGPSTILGSLFISFSSI